MHKSNVLKLTKEKNVKHHMEEIQNTIKEYVQNKRQIVQEIFPDNIMNQTKDEIIKEIDDNAFEKEAIKKIYEIVSIEDMDISENYVKGLVEYMLKEKSEKWVHNVLKKSYNKNEDDFKLSKKHKITTPPLRESKQTKNPK